MAAIFLVGNDGNAYLPSNYDINVKVWAANISYASSDTTGFSHSAKTRRLGVLDITGSLAGTPTVGNSGTPFGSIAANSITNKQLGGLIALGSYNLTATASDGGYTSGFTSSAILQFNAVFSSIALNTDKNGDATITLNYELNDSNGPSVVWATTLA